MLIRINQAGTVDGVILTNDQFTSWFEQLPNHQVVSLEMDVIPNKVKPYTVPIRYKQGGQDTYVMVEATTATGAPLLDSNGFPILTIKTRAVSKLVTLLDEMALFNIQDVIQQKYQLLASQNFYPNVFFEQFYLSPLNGLYDSGVVATNQNNVTNAVVHAVGDFKSINVSNDGGVTFTQVNVNVPTQFASPGNGQLRVVFDNAPVEYGVLYL